MNPKLSVGGAILSALVVISVTFFLASLTIWAVSSPTPTLRSYVHRIQVGEHGSCSGVMIADHVMLTAGHCVEGGEKLYAGSPIPATVVRFDGTKGEDNDIALLRVDLGCPCAPIATKSPVVDERVAVVGFPLPAFTLGNEVVTYGQSQGAEGNRIIMTAPAAPGNSGGGVFVRRDGEWQLVGILVEGAVMPMGFGLATFPHLSRAVSTETMGCFLDALKCGKTNADKTELTPGV